MPILWAVGLKAAGNCLTVWSNFIRDHVVHTPAWVLNKHTASIRLLTFFLITQNDPERHSHVYQNKSKINFWSNLAKVKWPTIQEKRIVLFLCKSLEWLNTQKSTRLQQKFSPPDKTSSPLPNCVIDSSSGTSEYPKTKTESLKRCRKTGKRGEKNTDYPQGERERAVGFVR